MWASHPLTGWSNGDKGVHYSLVFHHSYPRPSQQPMYKCQECGMGPESALVKWAWREIMPKLLCCWCTGGKMDETQWRWRLRWEIQIIPQILKSGYQKAWVTYVPLGDELQRCLRKKIKRRQKNDHQEGGGWSTVPVNWFRVALNCLFGVSGLLCWSAHWEMYCDTDLSLTCHSRQCKTGINGGCDEKS